MNKFVAASLIGSATAAVTPGALPDANFPKYPTVTAPSGSAQLDADNVLQAYTDGVSSSTTCGPYRGFRNNLLVAPTQTLEAATTSAIQVVKAAAAGTRTFYQLANTAYGSYPTKANTASGNESSAAKNASWVLCLSNKVVFGECNGMAGWSQTAGSRVAIIYRLVFQANQSAQIQVGASKNVTYVWKWNQDLLLASLGHNAWSSATKVEDGTAWCSPFKNELNKDKKTKATLTATPGLKGISKCTWQLSTTDGSVAPAFSFKTANYAKFEVQWIEWITTAGLGTDGVLPTTSAANYYIGDYATANGVFLNPLTDQDSDTAFKKSVGNWGISNRDPSSQVAGSIGTAAFYSGAGGINQQTNIVTADSSVLMQTVQAKNNEFNSFNGIANKYNNEKNTYNDAVTKENDRLKDIFKAAFDPKVEIPKRPMPPTPPGAFSGPYLDLSPATGSSPTAWAATQKDQGNKAYLRYMVGTTKTYAANAEFASRIGFLRSTADVTASTIVVTQTGHVFGRLGQGDATQPANTQGFFWGKTATANTPGIQLSLFPYTEADTGIASTKSNTIEAWAVDWAGLDSWKPQSQPSTPSAPMPPPSGAAALSVGISAALIVASLY